MNPSTARSPSSTLSTSRNEGTLLVTARSMRRTCGGTGKPESQTISLSVWPMVAIISATGALRKPCFFMPATPLSARENTWSSVAPGPQAATDWAYRSWQIGIGARTKRLGCHTAALAIVATQVEGHADGVQPQGALT